MNPSVLRAVSDGARRSIEQLQDALPDGQADRNLQQVVALLWLVIDTVDDLAARAARRAA